MRDGNESYLTGQKLEPHRPRLKPDLLFGSCMALGKYLVSYAKQDKNSAQLRGGLVRTERRHT